MSHFFTCGKLKLKLIFFKFYPTRATFFLKFRLSNFNSNVTIIYCVLSIYRRTWDSNQRQRIAIFLQRLWTIITVCCSVVLIIENTLSFYQEYSQKPYVNRFCISLYSKTNTVKNSGEVANLLQSLGGIFRNWTIHLKIVSFISPKFSTY